MKTTEAAEAVGLHPVTLARFARENRVPAEYVGGRHGWHFNLKVLRVALREMRGNKAQQLLSKQRGQN